MELILLCFAFLCFGIFVVGLGVGIFFLYRMVFRGAIGALGTAQRQVITAAQDHATTTDALAVLNKRLASGEITEDEYHRPREALERNTK